MFRSVAFGCHATGPPYPHLAGQGQLTTPSGPLAESHEWPLTMTSPSVVGECRCHYTRDSS